MQRSSGSEFVMAQFPVFFLIYLSTHLPNVVFLSQNEQLLWHIVLCNPTKTTLVIARNID